MKKIVFWMYEFSQRLCKGVDKAPKRASDTEDEFGWYWNSDDIDLDLNLSFVLEIRSILPLINKLVVRITSFFNGSGKVLTRRKKAPRHLKRNEIIKGGILN